MAQNLQIQQIPNDIEEIALNHLQQAKDVIKNIKEILNKEGNKVENNDNNKNQIISQKIKQAATNYLVRVDSLFNNLKNYKANIDHQQKEFADNFKDKNSFVSQLSQLKNLHISENYKLIIKSLYAETIAFQKIVNAALGQEILTIFVLDSKEGQIFYKFNLDKDTFERFNPSITEDGKMQYNINKNFLGENIEIDETGDRNNIIKHQAILANNEFGKQFNKALQNSSISFTKNLSESQLTAINKIRQQGLLEVFYTKEGILRQRLYSQNINNIKNFFEYFTIQTNRKGLHPSLVENIKITKNKERKNIGGKYFSKNTSFNTIVEELNLPKVLSPDAREFTMEGQTYKPPFYGSKGFLKEGFFGAYLGLEIGQHQIDLTGGNVLQIDYSYKFQIKPYLAQLDSAAGRLLGDYNVAINGTMHAIQIKGEGAFFNVWQFIELANIIHNQSEKNALQILKQIQSTDRAKGHTYQAYQVQDQQMAKKLLSQGIGKLKSTT